MYLQNDLIEAVPLDRSLVSTPGYLGKIKRHLKEKHAMLLKETGTEPEFIVAHLSSSEEINKSAPTKSKP